MFCLQALKELVQSRLVSRKYCGISGKNLQRCWPEWPHIGAAERERKLRSFSAKHGWTAKISPQCDRVTFRRKQD